MKGGSLLLARLSIKMINYVIQIVPPDQNLNSNSIVYLDFNILKKRNTFSIFYESLEEHYIYSINYIKLNGLNLYEYFIFEKKGSMRRNDLESLSLVRS